MLKHILFGGRHGDGIDAETVRAAEWFGLSHGQLSASQLQSLNRLGRIRLARRRFITRQKFMRRSQGTLWFTRGQASPIPPAPRRHSVLQVDVRHPLPCEAVASWINQHEIETLHVTAEKRSRNFVCSYLYRVLKAAGLELNMGSGATGVLPADCVILQDATDLLAVSPWPRLAAYQFRHRGWRRTSLSGRPLEILRRATDDAKVQHLLQVIPG